MGAIRGRPAKGIGKARCNYDPSKLGHEEPKDPQHKHQPCSHVTPRGIRPRVTTCLHLHVLSRMSQLRDDGTVSASHLGQAKIFLGVRGDGEEGQRDIEQFLNFFFSFLVSYAKNI